VIDERAILEDVIHAGITPIRLAGSVALSRREPIPTFCFSLVVVQLGRRYLVVREASRGQRWYLPAGRVEHGETFADAARRETLEESGIEVKLDGILKVEHSPVPGGARMRIIFVGRPISDKPPKRVPDDESLEARWVTLEELERLELRGSEVRDLFHAVEDGAPIAPMTLLGSEILSY
jgi:phosphatase NudJ